MGSASYTKGAKRVGGNHEWVGMNHEIHERREREIQNHEWTRMARRGNSEPRMDTNGHERKTQNHEWTRMDTNRWEGTTKHTKYTKGKLRATNGHEWNHEIQEWNHETHEKHEKRQGG